MLVFFLVEQEAVVFRAVVAAAVIDDVTTVLDRVARCYNVGCCCLVLVDNIVGRSSGCGRQPPRMVMCVHTHILTRTFLVLEGKRRKSKIDKGLLSVSRSVCLGARALCATNTTNKKLSSATLKELPTNFPTEQRMASQMVLLPPSIRAPVLLNSLI